jgi:hypothetical protein
MAATFYDPCWDEVREEIRQRRGYEEELRWILEHIDHYSKQFLEAMLIEYEA